jgi:glycosyltransferase involved in cell wall biosynthesis
MSYSVSLVIPLYNVEKYVRKSLVSALEQTFKSIEYILVDDCSTDGTMQIVKSLLMNHPRFMDVKILSHDINAGLSAARNTGLLHAQGKYVFFMDSDDEITIDCIEKHYNVIEASGAEFTVADLRLEGTKSIHVRPILGEVEKILPILSYLKREWNTSACNKLYKKRFLTENRLLFKNGLLHEDILWSYEVANKAKKISLVTKATYIYKVRKNSITTNKNNSRKINSLLFILDTISLEWKQGSISSKYENEYYQYIDFWCLNTALLLLNFDGSYSESSKYYSRIIEIAKSKKRCFFIFRCPFWLFYLFVTPIYLMYKRIR